MLYLCNGIRRDGTLCLIGKEIKRNNMKSIDIWFKNLDSDALIEIFPDVYGNIMADAESEYDGLNDFIDEVDEYWDTRMSDEEKEEMYNYWSKML